ncbi:MAG: hypothetical protein R6W68_15540 [Ignavibacteriaceae bacterium]
MKHFLVLFAFFLVLMGCQKEDSILNSPGDQLDKKVFTFSGSAEGFTEMPYGAGNPFRRFEGEGQSNIGDFEVYIDYIMTSLDPTTGTGTSGFANGELTFPDGSKMHAINGQGTFAIVGTTVTFSATAVLAGGTGDYDNIMGTLSFSGTIDQTNRATEVEWAGSFTRNRPVEGNMTAENITVTGSCNPGFVRRNAAGYGNASHFGKCFAELEHCISFTTGIVTDGTGSLTAPNGDKIYVAYDGYALPIPGTSNAAVSLFCTITGGEGKFEDASGYYWVKAIQTLPEGAAVGSFDGVINY